MLPLVPAARATTGLAVVATLAATAALVAHLTDIDTPLPSGAGLHLLLLTYVSVVGALVALGNLSILGLSRQLPDVENFCRRPRPAVSANTCSPSSREGLPSSLRSLHST